jgi:hypothetical protein
MNFIHTSLIILLLLPSICLSQQTNGLENKKMLKLVAENLDMDLDNKWLKNIIFNPQKTRSEMLGNINLKLIKYFKGISSEKLLSEKELLKYMPKEVPSEREIRELSIEIAKKMTEDMAR